MSELPALTEAAVEVLIREKPRLRRLLAGARRFPMRAIGREGMDVLAHEEEIRRRFESGENNLFRLCRDPDSYLEDPRHPLDAELHRFFVRNEELARGRLDERIGADLAADLLAADFLEENDGKLRSRFRLVSAAGLLLVADAYSRATDAVYLSDDSFHLAERLDAAIAGRGFDRVVDLGCGSGILGLSTARLLELRSDLRFLDVNPRALSFAAANARIAGVTCVTEEAAFGALREVGPRAFIVANPPFVLLPDDDRRLHSRGGELGLEHALSIVAVLDEVMERKSEAIMLCASPRLEGADRPAILERLAPGKVDVLVETAGIHPPFARYADFHAEQGVVELHQLVLRIRPGTGRVDHDPRLRRRRPHLFG